MAAAQRAELLDEKSGRTGGRVNQALVEQAKARPGIEADADLFDFALANIALDDAFAETFKALRGPEARFLGRRGSMSRPLAFGRVSRRPRSRGRRYGRRCRRGRGPDPGYA